MPVFRAWSGGNSARAEKRLPIRYKGIYLDHTYRIGIVADNSLVIEIKAAERITPVHEARLPTYFRLSGLSPGLLLNFNTPVPKDGIGRCRR